MQLDSLKSRDTSHPITGNRDVQITATQVAATLEKVPALLFAISLQLALSSVK